MRTSPLTSKQHAFVAAYVGPAGRDATAAAEIAGYRDAERQGAACMASSKVRAAIRESLRQSGGAHKFTVDRVSVILRAMRTGETYRGAAMFAGISEDTLLNWRKGEFPDRDILTDEESALADTFQEEFLKAEAMARMRFVGTVMAAAAQGDANVALRFLEMRYPAEFGKKNADVTVQLLPRSEIHQERSG